MYSIIPHGNLAGPRIIINLKIYSGDEGGFQFHNPVNPLIPHQDEFLVLNFDSFFFFFFFGDGWWMGGGWMDWHSYTHSYLRYLTLPYAYR